MVQKWYLQCLFRNIYSMQKYFVIVCFLWTPDIYIHKTNGQKFRKTDKCSFRKKQLHKHFKKKQNAVLNEKSSFKNKWTNFSNNGVSSSFVFSVRSVHFHLSQSQTNYVNIWQLIFDFLVALSIFLKGTTNLSMEYNDGCIDRCGIHSLQFVY